tara:strand:- start:11189 stop:11389 length:201 start_codon:yes stop_codon:yes gene_type:complete
LLKGDKMFLLLLMASTPILVPQLDKDESKYFINHKKIEKFNICKTCDNIKYIKLPTPMVKVNKKSI